MTEPLDVLEQELKEAVAAWQEMKVECISGLEHDYGTCAAGCKDGYVPDPLAAKLYEALTERCRWCLEHQPLPPGTVLRTGQKFLPEAPCSHCQGTHRTIRPWASYGEGALKGRLEMVLFDWANDADLKLHDYWWSRIYSLRDTVTDEEALRAVRQAMKEQVKQ